ncbi:MAG: hypothetical protein FJZ63_05660 [Chlamydiae bacterium]|nr:hypothetical protein [Chlamydiota bacterium]
MRAFWQKMLHFIYPAPCLACGEPKEKVTEYFCYTCQSSVVPEPPKRSSFVCFQECPVMHELVALYKTRPSRELAQLLASWIVVSFVKSGEAMPDYVVAAADKEIPYWKPKKLNYSLAKAVANLLNIPLKDCFAFILQDSVYDAQGELLGEVVKKASCRMQEFQGKSVLLVELQASDGENYEVLLLKETLRCARVCSGAVVG